MDLSKATIPVTWVGIIVLGAWEAYRFIDEKYAEDEQVAMIQAAVDAKLEEQEIRLIGEMIERDQMDKSTRYAELNRFYVKVIENGEPYGEADRWRHDLSMRMQERVHTVLVGEDDE